MQRKRDMSSRDYEGQAPPLKGCTLAQGEGEHAARRRRVISAGGDAAAAAAAGEEGTTHTMRHVRHAAAAEAAKPFMQESYLTHSCSRAQQRRADGMLELLGVQQALCSTSGLHSCCVDQQQQQQQQRGGREQELQQQQPSASGRDEVAVVRAEVQRLQAILQQLERQEQLGQQGQQGQQLDGDGQQQREGKKPQVLLPHTPPHPLKLKEARHALYVSHTTRGHIHIPK